MFRRQGERTHSLPQFPAVFISSCWFTKLDKLFSLESKIEFACLISPFHRNTVDELSFAISSSAVLLTPL